MRILITGGTGMVGFNIKNHPIAKKYKLLTPTRTELDLTNKKNISNWLRSNNPEFIIHAAGLVGGIHANIANPSSFLLNNLEIGCNLISEAAKLGIKNIINLGSSCMYPKDYQKPLKEEYLLQGVLEPTNEGYAIAKIATQRLCDYLKKEDKTRNFITIMPCNLYGEHDHFNIERSHLIASIIVKIHEAKRTNKKLVKIWGDGSARREFMYIEDISNAIWFAVPNIKNFPNIINVGLGYDHTILEYYKKTAEIIGYEGDFDFDLKKPTGMKRKLLDVKKINTLGWKSQFTLDYGLKKTYEHYLEII